MDKQEIDQFLAGIKMAVMATINKDNATAGAGGGYFKDWPESWLGPDGHYGLLLDGINVDGVQHRHKQLAPFGQVRFLPQNGEVLQQLASFHGGVNSGNYQGCRLVIQSAFLAAVILQINIKWWLYFVFVILHSSMTAPVVVGSFLLSAHSSYSASNAR